GALPVQAGQCGASGVGRSLCGPAFRGARSLTRPWSLLLLTFLMIARRFRLVVRASCLNPLSLYPLQQGRIPYRLWKQKRRGRYAASLVSALVAVLLITGQTDLPRTRRRWSP